MAQSAKSYHQLISLSILIFKRRVTMSSKINNYSKLEKKFEEITHLGNIAMIAHWDAATMLQKGSAPSKQKEMATFSSVLHFF